MAYIGVLVIFSITLSLTSGSINYGATANYHCIGSLVVAYKNGQKQFNVITLNGRHNITPYRYPNIRRGFPAIRNRDIYYLKAFGDCCWELYSEKRFNGELQILYPSDDAHYPDFQPTSIMKSECL